MKKTKRPPLLTLTGYSTRRNYLVFYYDSQAGLFLPIRLSWRLLGPFCVLAHARLTTHRGFVSLAKDPCVQDPYLTVYRIRKCFTTVIKNYDCKQNLIVNGDGDYRLNIPKSEIGIDPSFRELNEHTIDPKTRDQIVKCARPFSIPDGVIEEALDQTNEQSP